MSFVDQLPTIIRECKETFLMEESMDYEATDDHASSENYLFYGDNRQVLSSLFRDERWRGRLQTIYGDPPFFTKTKHRGRHQLGPKGKSIFLPAYDDRWNRDPRQYLFTLGCQLLLMRELLCNEGTLWMHLDWRMVHYVKILMDAIFGEENFINEIIWEYKSGGSGKNHFSRKHDSILLYGKTPNYKLKIGKEKSYNRGKKPYYFKGVKEFQDQEGWYTLVNEKDVWAMDMVGRTAKERTGYASQKPLTLLEKIIERSSEEGDLCGDFFCGSGSFAVASHKKNRRFICCDRSPLAMATTEKQCLNRGIPYEMMRPMGQVDSVKGLEGKGHAQISYDLKKDELTVLSYDIDLSEVGISPKDQREWEDKKIQLVDYWVHEKRRGKSWIRLVDIFGNMTEIEEEQWIK